MFEENESVFATETHMAAEDTNRETQNSWLNEGSAESPWTLEQPAATDEYGYDMSTSTPPGRRIITDTLLEQVLTAGLLLVFCVYVNLTNGFMIFVIRTSFQLQEICQYRVAVCYMVSDLLVCNLYMIVMIPLVIGDSVDILPPHYCQVVMVVGAGALYTSALMVAFLAFERYIYFVQPLRYVRYFSTKNILLVNLLMYISGFLASLMIELLVGRELVSTCMTCKIAEDAEQTVTFIIFIVFWVPSGCMSIITLIKLRLLTSVHNAKIASANGNPEVQVNFVHGLKRAIKMIMLVSGAFWFSAMPGTLLKVAMSAYGFTSVDLDLRRDFGVFVLHRTTYLFLIAMSGILNPVIYLSLQKDLRLAVFKRVRVCMLTDK